MVHMIKTTQGISVFLNNKTSYEIAITYALFQLLGVLPMTPYIRSWRAAATRMTKQINYLHCQSTSESVITQKSAAGPCIHWCRIAPVFVVQNHTMLPGSTNAVPLICISHIVEETGRREGTVMFYDKGLLHHVLKFQTRHKPETPTPS
jgi:hypothetical protein